MCTLAESEVDPQCGYLCEWMSLFVDWAGGEGRTPLKRRPLRPTAHYTMFFLILAIVATVPWCEASQAEAELYR